METYTQNQPTPYPQELLVIARQRTSSLRKLGVLSLVVAFVAMLPLAYYGLLSAALFTPKVLIGFGVGILVFAGMSKYLPLAADEQLRSLIRRRAILVGAGVGLVSGGIVRVNTNLFISEVVQISLGVTSIAAIIFGIILIVLGARIKLGKPDPALKAVMKSVELSCGWVYRLITALIWLSASALFIVAISLTRGNMFTFLLFPSAVAAQTFARSCFERKGGRMGLWAAVTAILLCASLVTVPFSFTGGLLDNRPFFASYTGETLDKSFDAMKVNNVKIEWYSGDIDIKPSSSDKVEIYGSLTTDDVKAECTLENGELTISAHDTSWFNIMDQRLTVGIPDGKRFGEFSVNSAAGDVHISADFTTDKTTVSTASGKISSNELCSAELELNTASGDVNVTILNHPDFGVGTSLRVSSASGDVSVNGDFLEVKLNTTSGNISVGVDRPGQSISAETVSGDTRFLLGKAVEGFTLGYETVSGDVSSSLGTKTPGKIAYNENSDFTAKLTAQSVSGNIAVVKN